MVFEVAQAPIGEVVDVWIELRPLDHPLLSRESEDAARPKALKRAEASVAAAVCGSSQFKEDSRGLWAVRCP